MRRTNLEGGEDEKIGVTGPYVLSIALLSDRFRGGYNTQYIMGNEGKIQRDSVRFVLGAGISST